MSSAVLTHSAPANYIGFLKHPLDSKNMNHFFVIDSENRLSTLDCDFECNPERNVNLLNKANLIATYDLPNDNGIPLLYHHWVWVTDTTVVFCSNNDLETTLYLGQLSNEEKIVKITDEIKIAGCIGNLTSANKNTIVYQFLCGTVHSIKINNGKLEDETDVYSLTSFCEKLEATTVGSDGNIKIIALRNQRNLYVNDKNVASEVTSFYVTDQFILFTTLDQLKFIRLDNDQIINERRIERGGKLVIVVPKDSRTVLQMPRGNLEAIQPRVLSLVIIGQMLDARNYRGAFDLMRKQRINLNLLVDHDPVKFLENLDHFVDDIQNIQWLNLFLSDLINDDVTVTMYSSNYSHRLSQNVACFNGNKIEFVCAKLYIVFLDKGISKYLLPIITTQVKQKHFEASIQIIWEVKALENSDKTNILSGAVSSQDALKYLLYLVNVSDLYNVALGTYDFRLVMFIAEKSQKDPKEYIPFLNELNGFEENYRKYKIDHHLKRFDKALEHIVKCGVEKLDECLNLISTHGLYTQALRLFKKDHECYKEIVTQFADYLRSKGLIIDACLMYERAGDYKQALLSAKHILEWKKCVQLMQILKSTDEEIQKFCL